MDVDITEPTVAELMDHVEEIINDIEYQKPAYDYEVTAQGGQVLVEILHWRVNADTGDWGWGRGGRRVISPTLTDSEIVRAIFGMTLAYEEHEVREFFTYKGARVFGPHIDVNALVTVADQLDTR